MKFVYVFLVLIMVINLIGCTKPVKSDITIYREEELIEETYNLVVKEGEIEGTLTLPLEKDYETVAIIIAGSGPTDRNGNNPVGGDNNCLKMLAHSLGQQGIATLRYDKRGVAESQSLLQKEEDLIFDNYIEDLNLWIDKLDNDNRFKNVVIIGHSEGALIGAVSTLQRDVKGYISIAGSGDNAADALERQLKAQSEVIYQHCRPIIEDLKIGKLTSNPSSELESLFRTSVQPYLISWFKYDPCKVIEEINVPVLLLQGENDLQVTLEDAKKLQEVNPQCKLVVIENMNHILKDATKDVKGNLETYSNPKLTLNKELVEEVILFIKAL